MQVDSLKETIYQGIVTKKSDNPGVADAIKKSGDKGKPGTTYTLAEKCGVKQPTVMHWLQESVSGERAVQIEQVTGVPRERIRPDLFKKK